MKISKLKNKTHQNYLVLYKGDISHIKTMGDDECGEAGGLT
jgi:hypothetical protein